jgi:ribonuclease T1
VAEEATAEPDEAPTEIPSEEPTAAPTEPLEPTPEPTATPTPTHTPTRQPTATPRPTATSPPAPTRASNLPAIAYDDLPPEAHDTIALIDEGGPFPFDRDGITFQNRERLLPRKPQGYYREYTVITPGSDDRGARRIVAGEEGELYYTDDHYESFQEVIR